MREGFFDKPAKQALEEILSDDQSIYAQANKEHAPEMDLLDRGILLYVEILQVFGKQLNAQPVSAEKRSRQASLAMASSALNYLLMARHGILHGYPSEIRSLLRDVHERITRSLLFFLDIPSGQRFLEGKTIRQAEVDMKLSELSDPNVFNELRAAYKRKSNETHPNFQSFHMRHLYLKAEDLEDNFGLRFAIGGLQGPQFGKAIILIVHSEIIDALSVIQHIATEGTGGWAADFSQLQEDGIKLLESLKVNDSN